MQWLITSERDGLLPLNVDKGGGGPHPFVWTEEASVCNLAEWAEEALAPHEDGMGCPNPSSGGRYPGQVEATYVWSDEWKYDRREKLNTYLHEVLWELLMLAKLFATHNWMVAVQQAYKKWDKKTALEQLDILSAAMTDAAEEDPTMSLTPTDVGWLDGKVIYL